MRLIKMDEKIIRVNDKLFTLDSISFNHNPDVVIKTDDDEVNKNLFVKATLCLTYVGYSSIYLIDGKFIEVKRSKK
jgi:hypothetical protein